MPRLRRLRRVAARTLPIATKDQMRAAAEESTTWAAAYERLLAAVQGRPVRKAPGRIPDPDPAQSVRAGAAGAGDPGKKSPAPGADVLLQDLRRGKSLEEAALRAVRAMLKEKRVAAPQALADALQQHEGTRTAGKIAAGAVAHHRRLHALAQHQFDEVPDADLLAFVPVEAIHALFAADPGRGVRTAESWIAQDLDLAARAWFELYRQLFVSDELTMAETAFSRFRAAYAEPGQQTAWPGGRDEIEWAARWSGVERNGTAPVADPARVRFGLIDYAQPGRGRASQNIGDQIQTLASLGHVVRHQNLRFHGDDDIVEFVEAMQERVRPELRRTDLDADVELVTVERDSSTYQRFAPNTWLLEFGWHMHALFGLDSYDFPLHPNLNPIFVSFHCSKRALLTPAAVEYLRAHGPIGCRDWTTVDLLLSLDVPAFFSGCLTTTVNTVFPDLDQVPEPATVYVDVARSPVPAGHTNVKQSYGEIKKRTFTENMWDAVDVLERYRTNFTDVVTTRLHCYLPTTSLGLRARFEPKNNADVRFSGLFRLDEQEFDDMRTRMRDRLEPVLTAIFDGEDRESVYELWRRTVAPEVEAARARHEDVTSLPDGTGLVRDLVANRPTPQIGGTDDVIDVVLTPADDELAHIAPVLRSAAAATARPLRAWILTPAARRTAPDVPGVEMRWIETGTIDLERSGALDRRSLDRALLPELVPVDRVVVLPVDAAVSADLGALAELDLGDARFGARSTSRADDSGFGVLYGAARRLDPTPEVAFEFYRRIHRSHVFDFEAFDTDVMVLDLDGLRADGYSAAVLPAMARYRLDERAAAHYIAGPHRQELGAEWGHVPTREHVQEPKLWHWADSTKPWSADFVPDAGIWRRFSEV